MITLLNAAGAFLYNGDKVLIMKRAANKQIAPGVWSNVGGRVEPDELNDPMAACLREIYEETGIESKDIHNLKLLYIIVRRRKDRISQSYIYFGDTTANETIQTDEGELHWVHKSELLDREYSLTFSEMMKHYTTRQDGDDRLYLGVAENRDGSLHMNWSVLEDFE